MKPENFDKLGKEDGNTVVNLLMDPDGDEESLLVSLVERGANGRRIAVAKSASTIDEGKNPQNVDGDDDSDDDDDKKEEKGDKEKSAKALDDAYEVELDLGQSNSEPFYMRIFKMIQDVISTSKSGDVLQITRKSSTDFEANLVSSKLWPMLYDATDNLFITITAIMHDGEVLNKQQAIDEALNQFMRFVSSQFLSVPALKSEDDRARIAQVAKTMEQNRKSHCGVTEQENPATITEDAANAPEGDDMDIEKMAESAAQAAVKAAKAANPNITASELVAVATSATTEVFKAAMKGPKQPSLPSDNLAKQRAMSKGENGSPKDPEKAMASTINSASTTVSKSEHDEKQDEAIRQLAMKIDELESTPRAGSGDGSLSQKGADKDDVFSGTAFSFLN